jgi:hypothetical protein
MRPWLGILASLVLCLTPLACDGKGAISVAGGGASVTAYFPHNADDRDNDGDRNDDDTHYLYYGRTANPTDRRESLALVRRYYAAAASENGAEACSMLVPFFAETVVERFREATAIGGGTCAIVMSKLFKTHHTLLAAENATFRTPEVRVQGDRALVILEFPTIPEVRQILLRRIAGAWRVLDLLDANLE